MISPSCGIQGAISKSVGKRLVHSTYPCKEVKFVKKQQELRDSLAGFLAFTGKSNQSHHKLSGKDDLFLDKLNNEQRPNIWWIQIKEGEPWAHILTPSACWSQKDNFSLCFRKWQHMFESSCGSLFPHGVATWHWCAKHSLSLQWWN